MSRRNSASDLKKTKRVKKARSNETKIYNCDVCQSAMGTEDDEIESEICKEWYHANCVGIIDKEYEVISQLMAGTIHTLQHVM